MKSDARLLIHQIKRNNMNILVTWFKERQTKYYRIGWSYLKNQHDIEDVTHSTILKVYENIRQLKQPDYFETWVTSIFINECKNIYRKRQKEHTQHLQEKEKITHTEVDLKLDLSRQVEQLDEPYKEVILLKFYSDYSLEEISMIIDIPIGTVKSRIYRGLKKLRHNWKGSAYI
ncbi:RNA polymerase sigma factor [Alkalihalobacillus pseudalcaliphilus]|uniref:RNA polymerase sigma factor n=1 Tax=Alkalihalobacillus pseudalcaliphilus TaxID=79884 RepID=UPI00069EAD7B|nr:sigma-70 family RNA polymerase sigma factor [Alkalihalobacillus pseudalcaliphilus]